MLLPLFDGFNPPYDIWSRRELSLDEKLSVNSHQNSRHT